MSVVPIIARDLDEVVKTITTFHRNNFAKNFPVAFSVSIDETKVPSVIQECSCYKAIVGGAAPDHFIVIPDAPSDCCNPATFTTDFVLKEMECFNGKKNEETSK